MFIVPGRTELILLSWPLSAANVLFIYSVVGSRGEPRQEVSGTESPEDGAFFKVHSLKFKATWKWKA